MLTPEQFVRALALTESNNDPEAWGDAGRAMGRWQVHPDWVWTWQRHYDLPPNLNEPWDSWVSRIVTEFATDHLRYMPANQVAMYFHLGHKSTDQTNDWDNEYGARFEACAYRVANA